MTWRCQTGGVQSLKATTFVTLLQAYQKLHSLKQALEKHVDERHSDVVHASHSVSHWRCVQMLVSVVLVRDSVSGHTSEQIKARHT